MPSTSLRLPRLGLGYALVLAATTLATPASATSFRVTMTVDNSYALFYGVENQATNFVGNNFNWPGAETYDFNLTSDKYLYVVTASDLTTAQGFLGQVTNLDTSFRFYSNDFQWQVTATGLGSAAPYSGSAADLSLLSREIVVANGGGHPSRGWTALTAGPSNGAAPWRTIAGIDSAARWVWYSSNGDPDPTTPGFNHNEWLIFRIPISAVPEPQSIALFASGLLAVAFARRRRLRH